MKYIVYVDYSAFYNPMAYEYIELKANSLAAAVAEADSMFDHEKMYIIRILEKTGKPENVESNIKAQLYTSILEKRSTKWREFTSHKALHFMSKADDWYAAE